MFNDHLDRWRLAPDGEPLITGSSALLPVRLDDAPAMLKVALHEEERRGGRLMAWWNGEGAARVLAQAGDRRRGGSHSACHALRVVSRCLAWRRPQGGQPCLTDARSPRRSWRRCWRALPARRRSTTNIPTCE